MPTDVPTDVRTGVHEEATRLDIHELVRRLLVHLGPTLVATLANVRDSKLPHRWAKSDGNTPRDEPQRRLLAAYEVWRMITAAESDHVARAWFIGANPRLDEASPIMRLREGDDAAVISAAVAFVNGADD